jgi:peroxidase
LYGFSKDHYIDPTLDAGFAEKLQELCPNIAEDRKANKIMQRRRMFSTGLFLDDTQSRFDNNYYANLVEGKGVLESDEGLYFDPRTRSIVELYACDQQTFFARFSESMVKMSTIGVKIMRSHSANGEIRANCHHINPHPRY